MSVLMPMVHDDFSPPYGYLFDCPGCKRSHAVYVTEPNPLGAKWSFNGNVDKPTFSPSLLQRITWTDNARPNEVCHLFVKDGMCEFCSDSTHELAGKTAPLVETNP